MFQSIFPSAKKATATAVCLMPKTANNWTKGTEQSWTAVQQAQVSHKWLKSGKALLH